MYHKLKKIRIIKKRTISKALLKIYLIIRKETEEGKMHLYVRVIYLLLLME